MTGRPKFSKGCYSCRRMKVKCDAERPSCGRCTRAGRTCPGYRELNDVMFRSMNSRAAGTPRSHAENDSTALVQPLMTRSATLQQYRPTTDWQGNSIAHFFRNFSYGETVYGEGYLTFLPQLVIQNPDSACLQEALLATSMTYLANVSSFRHLLNVSQEYYGRALRSIAVALADLNQANIDCTLTAMLLLQHFEIFRGDYKPHDPHQAGLMELVRLHGNLMLQSQTGKAIFKMIQKRAQIIALDGSASHLKVQDIELATPKPPHLISHLWRLLGEVSKCVTVIQNLFADTKVTGSKIPELVKGMETALVTQARLIGWQNVIPLVWKPRYITEEGGDQGSLPRETNFPSRVLVFKEIQQAGLWISFWCSRVHLLETLITGLGYLPEQQRARFPMTRDTLRKDLCVVIEDMCASAGYMLGDIDETGSLKIDQAGNGLGTFFLLRGMHVASKVPDLPQHIRVWVTDCLDRIGYSKGIRIALNYQKRTGPKRQGERIEQHFN